MKDSIQSDKLLKRAEKLIDAARKAGADKADAVVVRGRSSSVSVRMGKVENTNAAESDDFSLRVFVGSKVASIGAGQGGDDNELATRAVAMAKVSPEDPYVGLADKDDLVKDVEDLDLVDDHQVLSEELTDVALSMEAAAMGVKGVANSLGSGASSGMGGLVLATSEGFSGSYMVTNFARSVSVLAGEGTAMERDYDFDSRLFYADLDRPEDIGLSAAERAVKRLNPRKVPTSSDMTIVFDPRVSRGIFGHLISAINGGSIARKTSFLRDLMDEQVMAGAITIIDDPKIKRRSSSRPFDGEGVDGQKMTMIENGVLRNWYLSTSIANELGLKTNGRGARSGTGIGAASTNVIVSKGQQNAKDLIGSVKNGLYVTEVIGQGVNMVTGEYSRGASGFWIENGELTFPVSEITIASNLKDMFKRIVLADDIDPKYSIAAPTIAIEGMTIAGD
ncbi:TldD/PmbA family protein [Lentilitoribacter sp. Alg239-R112]|uniref:TldD/PmbA family protein n=1 Tax=Lentilitoribacter sp. Alg239-R112 TaxID=2305987 RepID=UPI0013A68C0E|nr:TldD/PmbA family protein [Lentilitoribacter sp. Alg239-R112]